MLVQDQNSFLKLDWRSQAMEGVDAQRKGSVSHLKITWGPVMVPMEVRYGDL